MPIDLAQVDWLYVVVLAVFVFLASLIGGLFAFSNRSTAAVLSAILFTVMFVAWTYYPHHLPLPTHLRLEQAAPTTPAPVEPVTPQRPRNPVTDVTPPKNPVTDVTPPAR